MNEKEEKLYIQGETEALKKMITHCQTKLQAFGVELSSDEKFSHERIEAIGLLRMLCDEMGDNDWEDDLHLSDIIQKHLVKDVPKMFMAHIGKWRDSDIFASSENEDDLKAFTEWVGGNRNGG